MTQPLAKQFVADRRTFAFGAKRGHEKMLGEEFSRNLEVRRVFLDLMVIATIALFVFVAGCSTDRSKENPLVKRGRAVYITQCASCHSADPSMEGPVGPAVTGSSKELIEARVLNATYPAGYRPKRTTKVMVPMPHLATEIDALTAFLKTP